MSEFDNWLETMQFAHGEVVSEDITEQGVRNIRFADGYIASLDVFNYEEPAYDVEASKPVLAENINVERDARELRLIAIEIASRDNSSNEDIVSRAHRIAQWLEYGGQAEQRSDTPSGEPEPAVDGAGGAETD